MAGGFPILFIAPSRIGDAVLSSGLVRKLHEEAPNARFTFAAGPASAPLYADVPGLERVYVMEKQRGAGHWLKLWRSVRERRWGLVVDMRGSGLVRVLRTRKKAVYARPPSGTEPQHKVMEAARLLDVEGEPPAPYLFVSDERQAAADALLGWRGEAGDGPILAMGPAANWSGKAWPSERFAVTAAKLLDPGGPFEHGRLLLLGGPEDKLTCRTVRHSLPRHRVIDLSGSADLLTGYAALKRARLFVGNDSGLMHMAAAAGAPTLGLFGPSDDRVYAPWGPHARALRGPRDFDTFRRIDPGLNQPVQHMGDLSVESVLNAARRLWAETEGVERDQRSEVRGQK
jgi:ADP-heptose:LPS heptosyltransferase